MVWLEPNLDQIVAVEVSRSAEFEAVGPMLQQAVRAEAASRRQTGAFIEGIKIKRVANMSFGRPLTMVRDWLVYQDSEFGGAIELGFTRRRADGSLYTQKPVNAFRGAIAKL